MTMDRPPLPPPFPVGTRLRYIGTRRSWAHGVRGERVVLEGPDLEVLIEEVHPGYRGTLGQFEDEDGPMVDDEEEPILDRTRDGTSVWFYTLDGERRGRLITHQSAPEWKVI